MTTSPSPPAVLRTPAAHEHAWVTESAHRTSEGLVRYVRCVACTARRVDVQSSAGASPTAVSIPLGAPR